jgi:hypothetical protein
MTADARVTWPPERFYWAIVEGVALRRPGPLPPGLLTLAADDIPADIDTLHAVGAPDARGRVIICAADRAPLASLPHDSISLTPAAVPDFSDADPAAFELLVGAFEPRSIRTRRLRRHAGLAATVLLCGSLVAAGAIRRAAHDERTARRLTDARATLLAAAGLSADELAERLARQHALESALARATAPRDVTPLFADLLRRWPSTADASVESFSLTDSRVLASVSLASDPAAFLAGVSAPPGWRLEEPRLSATRGLTRVSLELTPEPAP